jgi:hypothetical protein
MTTVFTPHFITTKLTDALYLKIQDMLWNVEVYFYYIPAFSYINVINAKLTWKNSLYQNNLTQCIPQNKYTENKILVF